MAISNVIECYNCEEPLTGNFDETPILLCPKCLSPNGPGAVKKFFDPFYVSEQLRKINNPESWMKFLKVRSMGKIIACADETRANVRAILHKDKNITGSELKEFVAICRDIGKLAKGLEKYVESYGLLLVEPEKEEGRQNAGNAKNEEVRPRSPPSTREEPEY
jgi:hypothetical protein